MGQQVSPCLNSCVDWSNRQQKHISVLRFRQNMIRDITNMLEQFALNALQTNKVFWALLSGHVVFGYEQNSHF